MLERDTYDTERIPGELGPNILNAINVSDIDLYLSGSEYFSLPSNVALFSKSNERKPDQRTQDAFHIDEERKLYIIADGMGANGDVASRIAVATFQEFFAPVIDLGDYTGSDLVQTFTKAGEETNRRIAAYAQEHRIKVMGTTLTLAHVFKEGNQTKLFEASVGDSGAYLRTPDSFAKISYSHRLWHLSSYVQEKLHWYDHQPELYEDLERLIDQIVGALDECSDEVDLAKRLQEIIKPTANPYIYQDFFRVLKLFYNDEEKREQALNIGEFAWELMMTRNESMSLANNMDVVIFRHSVRELDPTQPYTLAFFTDGVTDPLRTSQIEQGLAAEADFLSLVDEANAHSRRRKPDDITGFTVKHVPPAPRVRGFNRLLSLFR